MVAPIDAKVSFEVEGETFTLRLNFRTLSLVEAEAKSFLEQASEDLSVVTWARVVRSLAADDHPAMSYEEAMAIWVRGGAVVMDAVQKLFTLFGGEPEGNVKRAKTAST